MRRFKFSFRASFLYFGGFFLKKKKGTIIPLTLVVYEMIIANLAPRALFAFYCIPYPTRARGIIVNYNSQLLLAVIGQFSGPYITLRSDIF